MDPRSSDGGLLLPGPGGTELDPWLDGDGEGWLRSNASANSSLPGDDGDVYFMAAISVLLGIMILITIIGTCPCPPRAHVSRLASRQG